MRGTTTMALKINNKLRNDENLRKRGIKRKTDSTI